MDIADSEIVKGRDRHNINSYVPFHFFTKAAFDYVIKRDKGLENLCYITITREIARSCGAEILTAHPLTANAKKLSYDIGFPQINWAEFERVNFEDNTNKQTRMAECLMPNYVSSKKFYCIGVANERARQKVQDIVSRSGVNVGVQVVPEWFYEQNLVEAELPPC